MYFHYFGIISRKKKGGTLYLNKLESPSPKIDLWSLVEIGPVVLDKKIKMCKVYDNINDNDENDDRQRILSEKLTWAFGSAELKNATHLKRI